MTVIEGTETRVMEEPLVNMHGVVGAAHGASWAPPQLVTEFDVNARLTFTDIKAHEYIEQEATLQAKVKVLAEMIKKSEKCIAYTGAGMSTAAGIDDYATKAGKESVTAAARPTVKDWKNARPTRAHHIFTTLYNHGYLKYWIQQNHDSLPQKAGYPQHELNEIHGSLHDPANPVVPYYGELRDDLFAAMQRWEYRNDLCLAIGTSLSGMNADRVAITSMKRHKQGKSAGLVIVNLQRTEYDADCALRIFAKIDDVMELLAVELGIDGDVNPMDHVHNPPIPDAFRCPEHPDEDIFSVPFDAEGNPTNDPDQRTYIDLRLNAHVKLTGGPYAGDVGFVREKNADGHIRIRFENSIDPTFNAKRRPFSLWFGNWWIHELVSGHACTPGAKMPFFNVYDQ